MPKDKLANIFISGNDISMEFVVITENNIQIMFTRKLFLNKQSQDKYVTNFIK